MINLLAVFIGGGLGSLARFSISLFLYARIKTVFPIATLLSNLLSVGAMTIAILLFNKQLSLNATMRLLIITGFCGGFSTFSAFSYETASLIRSGNTAIALANILINIGFCIGIMLYVAKN